MLAQGAKAPWMSVTVIVLLTLLAVSILANFKRPEKQIAYPVAHLSGIGDPLFQREMGILLGPAMFLMVEALRGI